GRPRQPGRRRPQAGPLEVWGAQEGRRPGQEEVTHDPIGSNRVGSDRFGSAGPTPRHRPPSRLVTQRIEDSQDARTARKFPASKTQLRPDPRYGSKLVSKFINCLMHDGKKSIAQKVFYNAMELVERRLPNEKPVEVFTRAVENVKPIIEVRSKRVG